MFSPFFLYLRPVATFFSSLPLRPCYRTPILAAPFDLAPAVAPPYYFQSLLSFRTPNTPFARDAARYVAGRTLPFDTFLFSLTFPSPCVSYTVSPRTRTRRINGQALPCRKAGSLSLRFFVSLAIQSDSRDRHSSPPSANPCVPLLHYQLIPC